MKIQDFAAAKRDGKKISMVTAYDYTMASIAAASPVDSLLVGDSAAMVMHGFDSTLAATPDMMAFHTAAVARGAKNKFIVADMPFLSFRSGLGPAMDCVGKLMRAGAHAVKLEGVYGHEDIIKAIVGADVPVMGHIGLTPQSIHRLGGYKMQGKEAAAAKDLLAQAKLLEKLGCFALVAECIPAALAGKIARALTIPVIGIGSGKDTDGQVLVLQDMLGLYNDLTPKFVKRYAEGSNIFLQALTAYDREVKEGKFPAKDNICA